MKKKTFIRIILGLIGLYLIYFFYGEIKYGHRFSKDKINDYLFIFQESFTDKLTLRGSNANSTNVYNLFQHIIKYDTIVIDDRHSWVDSSNLYNYVIWEFRNLGNISLDEVTINRERVK